MTSDIPPQEQTRKWFRSHLLNREVELQELYDLPQGDLDLLMAETAEIRSDTSRRSKKKRFFKDCRCCSNESCKRKYQTFRYINKKSF